MIIVTTLLALSLALPQTTRQPAKDSKSSADAEALQLLKLLGFPPADFEQQMREAVGKHLAEFEQNNQTCSQEALDEFKRRLNGAGLAQLMLDFVVQSVEAHFSDAEVRQITEAILASRSGKAPNISNELLKKFKEDMPKALEQAKAAIAPRARALGEDLGRQIKEEHPEWCQTSQAPTRQK